MFTSKPTQPAERRQSMGQNLPPVQNGPSYNQQSFRPPVSNRSPPINPAMPNYQQMSRPNAPYGMPPGQYMQFNPQFYVSGKLSQLLTSARILPTAAIANATLQQHAAAATTATVGSAATSPECSDDGCSLSCYAIPGPSAYWPAQQQRSQPTPYSAGPHSHARPFHSLPPYATPVVHPERFNLRT